MTTQPREVKLATLLVAAFYYLHEDPEYVFGGESLKGMDCSGFMQTLFKAVDIKLPRVSADQIKKGGKAIPLGQELPGDLLGFNINDRNGDGVEHIGLCLGNGLMIHTAKPGEAINVALYKERYAKTWTNVTRVF